MLSLNCLAKEKERGDFALYFFGGRGGGMGQGSSGMGQGSSGTGQGSSGLGKHKNASGPTKSHIRLSIFKAR